MTSLELGSFVAGSLIAIAISIRTFKADRLRRQSEPVPVFVQDRQEFLSIWVLAHEWEGLDPLGTTADDLPPAIRRYINKVILAYFGKKLSIRKADGYRVTGHNFFEKLLGLDKEFEKLWECLTNNVIDITFLDSLYIRRSELLHWCPTEFIEPPSCWALPTPKQEQVSSEEEVDDADGWYELLSDRRKKIVACLEIAKSLWKQNSSLSYGEVFNHPTLVQSGLRSVFSLESFKKWARPFAPDEIKRGGRRTQSTS